MTVSIVVLRAVSHQKGGAHHDCSEVLADLETVAAREHDVQNYQVVPTRACLALARYTVALRAHLVPFPSKRVLER